MSLAACAGRLALPAGRLGIVVGLRAEARIAERLSPDVAIAGGDAAGARAAAQSLIARGVSALLSFGLAGGLDAGLPPGTVIIPSVIILAGARFETDPSLTAVLGGPTPHLLLGAAEPASDPAEKRALHTATGCAALDLETAAMVEAAAHKVPFAVLRVICDPADRRVPPAALEGLNAEGAIAPLRIIRSTLRDPTQIPDLLALARDATLARRALLRHVRKLSQDQPGAAPWIFSRNM